jgi:hypothetical protein
VNEKALAHWGGGGWAVALQDKEVHFNMTLRGTANGCRRPYEFFKDTNAKLLVLVAVSITVLGKF